MLPKSFSASAGLTFEGCERRYRAEYIDKIPDLGGEAGLKGSCCHAVLELWVSTGQHLQPWPDVMAKEKALKVVFDMTYYDYFSDKSAYKECWTMLNKWLQRTDFTGRQVLSTELKETFPLPTSMGEIPITYIWDRCDWIAEREEIEVIDYKTVAQPVQPDDLKHRIQPRLYALAANIKYPTAKAIWVTYDLLRFDTVSARFTRDDNVETWYYMQHLLERVFKSDGEEETLCAECRFCVRKQVCETLQKHSDGGGILGITDINEAVDRRAKLEMAANGMRASLNELDELILTMAEADGVFEVSTTHVEMKIGAQGRRHIDPERAAGILGPDIMQRYGKIGIGDLDDIFKVEDLTDSQKSQLKQLIRKQYGAPRVQTKLKSAFEEES